VNKYYYYGTHARPVRWQCGQRNWWLDDVADWSELVRLAKDKAAYQRFAILTLFYRPATSALTPTPSPYGVGYADL